MKRNLFFFFFVLTFVLSLMLLPGMRPDAAAEGTLSVTKSGDTLSWNAYEGASYYSYHAYPDDPSNPHKPTGWVSDGDLTFNMSYCLGLLHVPEDTYHFMITAYASDKKTVVAKSIRYAYSFTNTYKYASSFIATMSLPAPGDKAPSTASVTTDEGSARVTRLVWAYKSGDTFYGLSGYPTMKPGMVFKVDIRGTFSEGTFMDDSDLYAEVNGEKAKVQCYTGPADFVITYTFPAMPEIADSVPVTVAPPSVGAAPVYQASIGSGSNAKIRTSYTGGVYFGGVGWRDVTAEKAITDPTGYTFIEGHVYRFFAMVEPASGYGFNSSTVYTINGNAVTVSKRPSAYGNYSIIYYDFPALVAKPRITAQPSSVSSAAGKTVKFSVAAAGTGLSYRWQYSKDNGSTWANSSATGCNTATLSVEANSARNGYRYRCIVKNSAGSVTSSSAKLTIVTTPKITTQPSSVTSAAGKTVKFTVKASGGGLTYRWQYSKDGGSTWANSSAAGCNTATLSVEAASVRNGYRYRCIVKNAAGSVTSSSAKLTVVTAPSITAQPSSVTASAGKTVKFTVKAAGGSLSYRWQYSKDGGATWANSSAAGYNTATLTVEAISARNGYRYRCIVKNAAGSVKSASAKLTVN